MIERFLELGRGLFIWIRRHLWVLLVLVLLSSVGAYFIYLTTQHGIGLRDDSFSYFTAAEGLLSGLGYGRITGEGSFYPLTNFPPLYSILLALTKAAGLELAAGARLIAGSSFACAVGLAGLTAWVATRSRLTGIWTASLVLFSPSLLEVFSWAHSEDAYLVLMLGFLLCYTFGEGRRGKRWFRVSALIAITSAVLTRYIGVVLFIIPATSLIADWPNWRSSWGRWRLAFIGLPILVLSGFLVRNQVLSGGLTNRPAPSFHLPPTETIIEGGHTMLSWVGIHPQVLTAGAALVVIVTLAGILVGLGVWSLRRFYRPSGQSETGVPAPARLLTIHSLHAISYAILIAFSLLFLDRLTPLDDRILSPLLTSLLIILGIVLGRTALRFAGIKRRLLMVVVGLLLVGQIALGVAALRSLSAEGMGFNSPIWRSSRAIDRIAELPQRPIYTNNVAALYFLSNRNASFIPARYDPAGDRPRGDYELQLNRMRQTLEAGEGYLIILGWPPESALPPDHMADLTAGLQLVTRTRDGLIYCDCAP